MSETEQRILDMLQRGVITPAEADRLLAAAGGEGEDEAQPEPVPTVTGEVLPPPDAPGWRRFWLIPFAIGAGFVVLAGMWLAFVLRNTGGAFTFGAICLLGLTLFGAMIMSLAWWSNSARWLHVRVRSNDGRRVMISLPFSTTVLRWALNLGQLRARGERLAQLQKAGMMLDAWNASGGADPITIHVDDGDGDQVQIFIG